MRNRVVAALALLAGGGVAVAQPPGGGAYFGAGQGPGFDEKAIFPGPPGPPPPPKEVTIPDGSLPVAPPKLWCGSLEFGLNGNQGDNNVLNMKFGAQADRKTAHNVFHSDLLYTLNKQDGTLSQNQALLNARDEILFPHSRHSRWSLFSALQVEYDEFRSYDLRVGVYGGLGYTWVDNDRTLFKTRAGAGAVREMSLARGGPADRWVPESVFGFDFNRRLTDRQRFVSSVDVYPSLSHFGEYRVRARAAYECLIDPEYGMVLRLGIQERYDSNPGAGEKNTLNYFATLMIKF
jgi:hypothetical protein